MSLTYVGVTDERESCPYFENKDILMFLLFKVAMNLSSVLVTEVFSIQYNHLQLNRIGTGRNQDSFGKVTFG